MSSLGESSTSEALIEFRGISYMIASQAVLRDVHLRVAPGETLVLLGRSGAGKTTALKLINRLLVPSYGEVVVAGRSTTEWDAIALRRSIGWVIQETGLFPHYSVEQNIAVVPKLENWPWGRVRARVEELMQLVGLEFSLRTRYPHQLSGGQRQRVGVARALAADPKILLMDEPFGSLDPLTRAELEKEFQRLQQRLKKTVVMVTHDLRQALTVATRLALIEEGKLVGTFTRQEFVTSADVRVQQYTAAFRETALPV